MNAAEALRSIRYDWLSYIQEKVRVNFENAQQAPVDFTHRTRERLVHEVLGRFRIRNDSGLNGFLVKADDGEVYFLYFHKSETESQVNEGYWILGFRILSDNELMAFYRDDRKMLVDMTVKRVVDFHGHLCPELAIGMKACEYALELLFKGDKPSGRISVVAENCTSALDALQVLLGVTLGNQALKVIDFGKHNYTFSSVKSEDGFTLRLKGIHYGDEQEYEILEERIVNNQISLDEVVKFQGLLDERVRRLLSSRPEDLFDVVNAGQTALTMETPATYLPCPGCGQQVLREHTVEFKGRLFCAPCAQRNDRLKAGHNLH